MRLTNPTVKCPKCGHCLDAATSVEKENLLPKEGDLSVCIECASLLMYEEGYFLHLITEKELSELRMNNPRAYDTLHLVQAQVRRVK
jgi:hypothetical protein